MKYPTYKQSTQAYIGLGTFFPNIYYYMSIKFSILAIILKLKYFSTSL